MCGHSSGGYPVSLTEVATNMRVLLVGASGVIGRPMIGMLTAAGHTVIGTTRDPKKAEMIRALGAEPMVLDAYNHEAVVAAVQAAHPDAIINQLTDLSNMDVDGTSRLRRDGTQNLVDAAKAAGVRRMLTQSIAFVYAPAAGLATEDAPLAVDAPEPWNGPAVGIALMEEIANELPESVILRYGFFVSPTTGFNNDGFTAQLIQAGTLPANDNITSFIHVDDAAEATVRALDWPAGVYNIVDSEPVAASVWVPIVARANGAPTPQRVVGIDPTMSRGASNVKARALGWTPKHPSWRDALTVSV
jgi:nucleoside-diphosphate-sugar epimerase